MKQLLNVPSVRSAAQDKSILKKTQSKKKSSTSVKGGGGLSSRISSIIATVEKYLGKYKEQYRCIITKDELNKYIDQCIEDGICAIDTETTGLDPMQDEIVGFSICCPTLLKHPAYIPINHVSFVTGQRVKEQMSVEDAKECLDRLSGYRDMIVMFNGVFDCRFIKNQVGVLLKCFWDTSVASRCMNENEQKGQKGLKKLHQKYVLKGQEDAFKFDELFEGLNFALVPIKTGFLYAAHDARITLELYEYQKQYLYYDPTCEMSDRNGMNGVSWMFLNIEMPIVEVDVELEDTGVALDFEYCKELQEKYSKLLKKTEKECYKIVDMYKDEIAQYNGSVHLDDPVNLSSPKQLAVLLYDIMGEKSVDKDKPRGTGEDILAKMKTPLGKAILEYRSIEKLMGTYIEKMPAVANKKDKRVHCKFNQYGADTGRFSSNDPNLQNIPSHNKDIRKMFKATDHEYLVDFEDEITVGKFTEIETDKGWMYSDKVKKGDVILSSDGEKLTVKAVKKTDDVIIFKVESEVM